MYRINVDIRGAIRELRETSMKSWYETKMNDREWKAKVQPVPEFEEMLKRSGWIKKVKNKIVKYLKVYANVFIETKEWNVRNQPLKIDVLDPRYVSIVTDSELTPLRYIYKPPIMKGDLRTISPQNMLHYFDDEDNDNPAYWMTALETIVLDVMWEEAAQIMNYYSFVNDNIPAAIYVLKEKLTKAQQDQAVSTIENTLRGPQNKHKAIISTMVEDIKPISQGPKDMEHEKTRRMTTEKVCVALWVPRTVLGYIEDVNHSNGESQYEKFIENTVRPLERTLEEIFTHYVSKFNELIYFTINDEHINDIERRSKLARENAKEWLWTRNEARSYIWYEKNENEMMDEIIIPANYTPIDAISEPVQAQEPPIAPEPVKIKFIKN